MLIQFLQKPRFRHIDLLELPTPHLMLNFLDYQHLEHQTIYLEHFLCLFQLSYLDKICID